MWIEETLNDLIGDGCKDLPSIKEVQSRFKNTMNFDGWLGSDTELNEESVTFKDAWEELNIKPSSTDTLLALKPTKHRFDE